MEHQPTRETDRETLISKFSKLDLKSYSQLVACVAVSHVVEPRPIRSGEALA
jgi:hypothetical protein